MVNLFREVCSISVGICTFALMFLHIFSMSLVVSFGMDKSMTQVQGLHRKAKIVSEWWFRKKIPSTEKRYFSVDGTQPSKCCCS